MRRLWLTKRRTYRLLQAPNFQDALSETYCFTPNPLQQLADNDYGPRARPSMRQSPEDMSKSMRNVAIAAGSTMLALCGVGFLANNPRAEVQQEDRMIAAVRTALGNPDALKATATCAQDIEKHIQEVAPPVPRRTFDEVSKIPLAEYRQAADLARTHQVDCDQTSGITGTWQVRVDNTWIAVTKETILDPPV